MFPLNYHKLLQKNPDLYRKKPALQKAGRLSPRLLSVIKQGGDSGKEPLSDPQYALMDRCLNSKAVYA